MTTMHELKNTSRPKQNSKRVGRGPGCKKGKTCGRGNKGAGSRSGWTSRATYEGGQMRLFMKSPLRGFSNARFQTKYEPINFDSIEAVFENGETVNHFTLFERGLISSTTVKVKLLANGDLTKKVSIELDAASKSAVERCQSLGIELKIIG